MMNRKGWVLLLLALLTGCGQIPDGVQAVQGFDADRYLGQWYEVARLENSFERGLTKISATYSRREGGGIAVVNRGFDPAKGEWREARGRAKFSGPEDVAMLKVSFFGPFYSGYNVVDLDPTYSHALVVGANRSYLWILSRQPDPPREVVDRLVARAAALGFDTRELVFVEH
jgi:apolipoprotein D and lipocalin family protein